MPSVIAFGRVGGVVAYQYGPLTINKDWGGVFTALAIMDMLEKVPASVTDLHEFIKDALGNIVSEPPQPDGVTDYAQNVKRDMLLAQLEVMTLDIEHLQVTSETARRFSGNSFSAKMFRFESMAGKRPSLLVARGLIDMGLNTWGYLNQIVMPLSRFTDRSNGAAAGHRCMNVFFTV